MTNPAPEKCTFRSYSYRLLSPDPCKQTGFISSGETQILPSNSQTKSSLPGWRKRIVMKQNATTNYARTITRVTHNEPCTIVQDGTTSCTATGFKLVDTQRTLYSTVPGLSFPGIPDAPDLDAICTSKLHHFAQREDVTANVLIPLVELREFHGLVRGIISSATNLVGAKHLILDRVKSRHSLNRILSDAGNAWLTWSFGISPMINDAKNLAEAVAAAGEKPVTQHISAKAEKQWTSSSERTLGMDFAGTGYIPMRLEHLLSHRWVVGMNSIAQSAEDWGAYSSRLQLNLGGVVPAIWELIPYSWLIDYFTNVGSYLDDTFACQRSLIYASKNRRYDVNQIASLKRVSSTTSRILHPGSWSARCVQFTRSIESVSSLPRPTLRIRTFDEIAHNANNRLLNLISLLWTRNKNIVTRYGYENKRRRVRGLRI